MTPELDGMATLTALLPADRARRIEEQLDVTARSLRNEADEDRTLAQIRADVLADLVLGGSGAGGAGGGAAAGRAGGGARDTLCTRCAGSPAPGAPATVFVTVPALSLIAAERGEAEPADAAPALLDGYGPIPMDMALELAAGATHWVRVLTHPITGTMLDVERTTYRVPTSLRRWLAVRRGTCVFAGCGRSAHRCDIDHRRRWVDGGTTSAANTDPLCEHHHRLKEETRWTLTRDPVTDDPQWTSPTGIQHPADPPPF